MPKELQIVHICEDEKFINSAVEQFEDCFPRQNTFFVLPVSSDENFKHVKSQTFIYKTTPENLTEVSSSISNNAIVVLHSLSPRFYDFVLQLPKNIKIIWFCFGYEVYNDSNYFKNDLLLDKFTKQKFPETKKSVKDKIKEAARPYYRLVKPILPLSPKEYKRKVMQRIDYLGSSFYEEYQQVCKLIRQNKKFFDFWYYPLELIIDVQKPIQGTKSKILIGNSGFKPGNHLDVFDAIKGYTLTEMEIVVPLNYGETKYIQAVLAEGEKDFNKSFKPILDFMPLSEYNAILESIGVAILNNKRQQAVGNTIALLWFGAKVFLSNKNPFYHYLKRKGVIVYCYDTELNEKSILQFLSFDQIEHNRIVLYQKLNQTYLVSKLKEQINQFYA
jgi:hypothetical protein